MAGIARVHGAVAAQGFYGLQPLVVKVGKSNVMTATTYDGNGNIDTIGGYDLAVTAIETVASIVWLGAVDGGADYVTAVVDGATINAGAGATTAGAYGALKDALASQLGGTGSDYTVTTSSTLNGVGTFTFA